MGSAIVTVVAAIYAYFLHHGHFDGGAAIAVGLWGYAIYSINFKTT